MFDIYDFVDNLKRLGLEEPVTVEKDEYEESEIEVIL